MTSVIIVIIVIAFVAAVLMFFVRRPMSATQTDAEIVQSWIVDTVYKTGCPLYAHWHGKNNLRVGTLGPINDTQIVILKKCVAFKNDFQS